MEDLPAVKTWQKWALGAGGGVVGLAFLRALVQAGKPPPWGLWIDNSARDVDSPSYWSFIRELGVSEGAIMVDSSRLGWDPRFEEDRIAHVCSWARMYGVKIVLTTWPTPDPETIAEQEAAMSRLLSHGAVGWEVDLKEQWTEDMVRGYHSLAAAAGGLLEAMYRVKRARGIRLELTTHTGHRECSLQALVTPFMDVFYPQLYSTRENWRDELIEWGSELGPGRNQDRGVARARLIPGVREGRVRLGIGLALWDQRWPGHSKAEALSRAYRRAVAHRPVTTRGWSSKFVVPWLNENYDPEISAWLQRTARRARKA